LKAGVGVDEDFQSRREGYTGTDSPLLQCHMLQRDIPSPPLWQLDNTGYAADRIDCELAHCANTQMAR
jgi:hypothetical protein